MTTIIADFDSKTIVADSQCTYGGSMFTKDKIFVMASGELIGCAGDVTESMKFVEWYRGGRKDRGKPSFMPKDEGREWNAIVVAKDGLYLWNTDLIGMKMTCSVHAIGSGADYALGAHRAGVSLHRAVEVACELDIYSCGPITSETMVDKRPPVRKRG